MMQNELNIKDIILNNLKNNNYDFGTGIWPFINDKFSVKINSRGEYQVYLTNNSEVFSDTEIELLKETNCNYSSVNEYDVSKELFGNASRYDKRIGFYRNLYAGHVTEGNYRENASSGGFGTWIFTELLERGYIDSVIHVKKADNNPKMFEYSISKSIDQIIAGAKTKYYPVELSEVLKIVKENPGKYAFIGVPSFVMEMRLLCKQDSVINERIKFVIGLVCGHQKSTKFADFLAWQCDIKPGNLLNINFRKKLDYGPSSSYAIEVEGLIDGEKQVITKEMSQIYNADWGKGLFKIKASDFSDDIMNETADVTLGDAWLPEYTKDSMGNNIIVVRNKTIDHIIKEAIKEKRIAIDKVDPDTIYRSQLAHYRHSYDELGYRLYKKNFEKKWVPKKRVNPSKDYPFVRRKIQDIREKYCDLCPAEFNKAVEIDDFNYFKKKMKVYDLKYRALYKIVAIQNRVKQLRSKY